MEPLNISVFLREMKKILIITTISGFVQQFEMNDVKLMQEYGFEVHYASNFDNPVYACDKGALSEAKVKTYHISIQKSPAKLLYNIRALKEVLDIISGEHITHIHCHNPMGGVTGRLAKILSKRPLYVIYTAHGFHFYDGAPIVNRIIYANVERFLARWTDEIVTINREDARHAAEFGGHLHVSQIHSVGVDNKRFYPDQKVRVEMRRKLGIPMDAFHIVTAAELVKNKNQKVIIEAIKKLDNPKIIYSICGKGPNEKELKKLIKKMHLENQVFLRGYRNDVEDVLRSADLFAFPSIREGLGVAAVEALLTGVPLIVMDNRGTREYAVDGYNCLVCKKNSADEFAAGINSLYEDRKLLARLAENTVDSAKAFTIPEVEKTMRGVYERSIR